MLEIRMTDELVDAMIRAAVMTSFDHATEAFKVNPTGDNWLNLENAMWARQAVATRETINVARSQIMEAGIGSWVAILRRVHEGKKV